MDAEVIDYTRYTLQELLAEEVFIGAKRAQRIEDSPAAVFVIGREMIRRSAARSIPDLLRLVPGFQVAQINAYAHAISSRGFNSSFANKLLVLVDGRSVYTPEFSGVYWEMIGTPLEEIERIEVVRGPGGTLWGANAVNGVINIITRPALETHGSRFAVEVGNEGREATLSQGGAFHARGGDWHYRLYASHREEEGFPEAFEPLPIEDGWWQGRAGFRIDGDVGGDRWLLTGGGFRGQIGEDQPGYWVAAVEEQGAHLLFRWEHEDDAGSDWRLQLYADLMEREDPSLLSFDNRTLDLELQRHQRLGDRHDLVYGIGYRHLQSATSFWVVHEFDPAELDGAIFNLFLQDEITLIPERLRLTVGGKLEHHYGTGWGLQPNLRLWWQPWPDTTLWGAVSRAVRTPSRFEADSRVVTPDYLRVSEPGLEAESLLAWELGVRHRLPAGLSLDATLFLHRYRDLIVVDTGRTDPTGLHTDYRSFSNGMDARSWGLELSAEWRISDRFNLRAGYTLLEVDAGLQPGIETSDYAWEEFTENRAPRHQLYLQGGMSLGRGWELGATWRYVDELPAVATDWSAGGVDGYQALDLRLGWQAAPGLELSLIGRNLFAGDHVEFGDEPQMLYFRNRVEPSVSLQLRWEMD